MFPTSWNGTAEVSLRSGGAISGSFTGSVTAFGLNGTTTGSIVRLPNGQGRVSGTVRADLDLDGTFDGVFFPPFIEEAAFSFVLGESLPPDINRPVFGSIADIVVTVSTVDAEVPVEFQAPVATDNRDGTITASCDPGPGVIVSLAGRTVTCTAADSSGNTATTTFQIIMRVEEITVDTPQVDGPIEVIVAVSPEEATAPVGRGGRTFTGTLFSTPQPLGTTTAAADGRITFRSILPTVEPGVHHIVLTTTAADGRQLQVIVPLVVGANGELVEILGRAVGSPGIPPGGLPATGSETWGSVRVGLLLVLLGLALLGTTRRRRLRTR